jgi:glycosyltransferase involved in cell wall biosynthesis
MRLLVVTHYYPSHRGGIEIVAGELARRLAAGGIEATWAASDTTDPPAGMTTAPMRTWNGAERRLGFPYPLWSPGSLAKLGRLAQAADVIHLHDSLYAGNVMTAVAARRHRTPLVITQHIGEVPYNNPALRLTLRMANRAIARRLLGRCDQAVFISPRVRRYFHQFTRFRRPPIDIFNGVDLDQFHPGGERPRDERLRCLFVGRFVEKKGLHLLRGLAERRPDVEFFFAGWGPIDPERWGLPNVRGLGSLSTADLANWYRAVDLLALPSVGEGFPLVIQEAAACGLPALISRETAEGHDDITPFTYVCEPRLDSLDEAIGAIQADRGELFARRDLAARFAASHWGWERTVEQYRTLFDRVARRSS